MKLNIDWKRIFISLAGTFLALMLVFAVENWITDWTSWQQATSMPDKAFNETIHDGFMRQPWNTVSSLAYTYAGIYLMLVPFTKKAFLGLSVMSSKLLRAFFGLSLVITGLGSAFLHMSMTFIGQATDVIGMYFMAAFIIIYAFREKPKLDLKLFTIIYLISVTLLTLSLIFLPETRRYLFAILLVAALLLEHFLNRKVKGYKLDTLLAAASVMLFVFMLWYLDNSKLFFDPDSWFQGHVFWHFGGALAGYMLFQHYKKGEELRLTLETPTVVAPDSDKQGAVAKAEDFIIKDDAATTSADTDAETQIEA